MIEIPKQLQNEEFRFCKIVGPWNKLIHNSTDKVKILEEGEYTKDKFKDWKVEGKRPKGLSWQINGFNFKEIKDEDNYGVICGYGNLRILDIDDTSIIPKCDIIFKNTFNVETGSGGRHYYFLSDYELGTTGSWGEYRAKGQMVIGPGSKHPSGKYYRIHNNKPLEIVQSDRIKGILEGLNHTHTQETLHTPIGREDRSNDEFREIIKLLYENKGKEEIFKHMENQIFTKWNTHGKRYPSYRNLTYEKACKYILERSDEKKLQTKPISNYEMGGKKPFEKLELLKIIDFDKMEGEDSYIVEGFIYPGCLTMIYSPPKAGKSIILNSIGMCISEGVEWLGLKTNKSKVLLCDKENNPRKILKPRFRALCKGLKLPENLENFYVVRQGTFGDEFLKQILQAIEEHKIELIIFDTLRRFANFREDKSDDVNAVYQKYLKPILEKNVAVVIIHHSKKDGGYRGSSDLFGMVDDSYALSRYENKTNENKFKIAWEGGRMGGMDDIIGEFQFFKNPSNQSLDIIKLVKLDDEPQKKVTYEVLAEKVMGFAANNTLFKRSDIEEYLNLANVNFTRRPLDMALRRLVVAGRLSLTGRKYSVVNNQTQLYV